MIDDQHNDNKTSGKPLAVLIGFALFAAISAGLLVLRPLTNVDPESLPSARTWVWWTAKEYVEQTKAPDVVVLGASGLMHCLAKLDADHLQKEFDYLHHHRSDYLAETLGAKLGEKGLSCFNFALPGAMLSDDYLVVHGLLKGSRQPKVLVLGLAPRDFFDCLVNCPASTPPFKYLKRYSNIDDVVHLAMPQVWQRIDYWAGRIFYVHGKKLDMQVMLSQWAKQTAGPWCQRTFPQSRLAEADPSRNMPGNMRSEVEERMYMLRPNMPITYDDNTAEYRRRYRHTNKNIYKNELVFFEKLMKDCKDRGIRVVLASLPLTADNRKLLPAGFEHEYRKQIADMASRWNVQFVDLADSTAFVKEDFSDPVHMNSTGGRKFVDQVVQTIISDPQAVTALCKKSQDSQIAGNSRTNL